MDLSKITAKINSKLRPKKTLEVMGVVFELTVPTFEQQAILDDLTSAVEKSASKGSIKEGAEPEDMDESSVDSASAEELARRAVAYALHSVDGEALDPESLVEEVRAWPGVLIAALSSAAMNYRYEVAARMAESAKFEWFNIKEFSLKTSAAAVHKAVEEERAREEEAARSSKYSQLLDTDSPSEDSDTQAGG